MSAPTSARPQERPLLFSISRFTVMEQHRQIIAKSEAVGAILRRLHLRARPLALGKRTRSSWPSAWPGDRFGHGASKPRRHRAPIPEKFPKFPKFAVRERVR